jgi:hypothetical protein
MSKTQPDYDNMITRDSEGNLVSSEPYTKMTRRQHIDHMHTVLIHMVGSLAGHHEYYWRGASDCMSPIADYEKNEGMTLLQSITLGLTHLDEHVKRLREGD